MSALGRRAEPRGDTPIQGPSALGGDRRRFLHLTWTLAVTEFRLRFFGSALGYLWQLMRPLLLFGVLYVVFTQGRPARQPDVPYYSAVAAHRHRAVHVLRRGHGGCGALAWSTARTWCARSSSRGW